MMRLPHEKKLQSMMRWPYAPGEKDDLKPIIRFGGPAVTDYERIRDKVAWDSYDYETQLTPENHQKLIELLSDNFNTLTPRQHKLLDLLRGPAGGRKGRKKSHKKSHKKSRKKSRKSRK